MTCIKCNDEATAICKFCGRAVCNQHIQAKRFATGFTSVGGMLSATDNAFSVEDAVWCGTCHPVYHRSS
jgi:hypothetical protein